MRSTLPERRTWKYAALALGALFSGYGVTLVLFKRMPNEFGPSGTLIAPGVAVVCGALVVVTTVAALIDRLALKLIILDIAFFLMGLVFALYLMFPESTDKWLFAVVPVLGVPIIYCVVICLAGRFKTHRSHQR